MGARQHSLAAMGLAVCPDSFLLWDGPIFTASELQLFVTVCHCHIFDAAFGDDKTIPHLTFPKGISVSWAFSL